MWHRQQRTYQQLIQLVLGKAKKRFQIAWGSGCAADRAGVVRGQPLQQAAAGEHVLARQMDAIENGLGRDGINELAVQTVGIHILVRVVLVSCVQHPTHATHALSLDFRHQKFEKFGLCFATENPQPVHMKAVLAP